MEKTENKRKHLRQRLEERKHRRQGAMLTPAEIREHLDKYVIGQEQATTNGIAKTVRTPTPFTVPTRAQP